MRYSLSLPVDCPPHGGEFHTQAITEVAVAIEANGYDACFVTDHPFPPDQWAKEGGHHALDPLVALAFAGAVTTRLLLHTNVLIAQYRNPFVAAKGVATLDALSNGRVILGLAAGYLEAEFTALGVPFRRRGRLLDDSIRLMKQAWTGEPVDVDEEGFSAKGHSAFPTPAQKPHPPIWVGGNSEAAMRRAVTQCDGWIPFPAKPRFAEAVGTRPLSDLDDLARFIDEARQLSDEVGRTKPLDFCFTPFSYPHGKEVFDPEAFIEEATALEKIGVTWIDFHLPAPSKAAFLENIERFAVEALAPLR